jgi:hypothetical protein
LARRLAEEAKKDSSELARLFLPFLETAFEEESHRLTERSEMLLMMIRDAIVDRLLVDLEVPFRRRCCEVALKGRWPWKRPLSVLRYLGNYGCSSRPFCLMLFAYQ